MTDMDKGTNEIVIAQDGSPSALAATGIAIQIAQSQGLSIHGLYVVDETLALDPYVNYHRELESERSPASRTELLAWFKEQGDAALQLLESRCRAAGVPVRAELLAGGVPGEATATKGTRTTWGRASGPSPGMHTCPW
jgi:nucleotide-binding universal stress UspA family protein